MPILVNRLKESKVTSLLKVIIFAVKKLFIVILLVITGLLINLPRNNILSKYSLEAVGLIISGVTGIYEKIFITVNDLTNQFQYLKDLKAENALLKSELAKTSQLLLTIDRLEAENTELRKLTKIVDNQAQYTYKIAKLLAVSINPFSKSAIINAGSNQDILLNQLVLNDQGLIGRVIEVSPNYSRVLLINDYTMRIPVTTISSSEKGILVGNDDFLTIKYLQDSHKIIRGEMVVTSGDGKFYPSGILVGIIASVNDNEVQVVPSVNLYTTNMVIVMGIASNPI